MQALSPLRRSAVFELNTLKYELLCMRFAAEREGLVCKSGTAAGR